MASPIAIPVVVLGGGAAGLTLSIFLSNHGVNHVLLEKHPTTSLLPKAHYINQRTMEIFRQHGVADAIVAAGCATEHMSRVDFRTSLGGDGPFDGKLIGSIDAFGGGDDIGEVYRSDSPIMPTNIPLLRTEPILLEIAKQKNPDGILFSHHVKDFVDDGESVLVTVQTPDSTIVDYRCQYLVAADAGKVSHAKLGVTMEGPSNLACMASTHFKADLSQYHSGKALITHFMSPRASTLASYSGGALVPMGPTWGPASEEWSLHFGFPPDAPVSTDPDFLAARIRELLCIPDLPIEIIRSSRWIFDRVIADKFFVGRVFLAGDAAHRIPPAGGLGMNTAIEDSLNLAFKLSLVLKNKAGAGLLDTYEIERRPVAIRNADWGLFCLSHFPVLQAAVALQPGNEPWNNMRMAQLFSDSPASKCALHAVQRVMATQDIEFQARDLELGFRYEGSSSNVAIVPNPSADKNPRPFDLTGRTYVPSTRPGGRLPHAPLRRAGEHAASLSTQDLLRLAGTDFLLITDPAGSAWREAAASISSDATWTLATASIIGAGEGMWTIGNTTVCYGAITQHTGCELYVAGDGTAWKRVKGVGIGGAVLVRGDNFVAWRSAGPPAGDARTELAEVLATICRLPRESAKLAAEQLEPPSPSPSPSPSTSAASKFEAMRAEMSKLAASLWARHGDAHR